MSAVQGGEGWWERKIAHIEQFLLFPHCFLPFCITFSYLNQIWNCPLQTLSDWKSLKFVVWARVKDEKNKYNGTLQCHVYMSLSAILIVTLQKTIKLRLVHFLTENSYSQIIYWCYLSLKKTQRNDFNRENACKQPYYLQSGQCRSMIRLHVLYHPIWPQILLKLRNTLKV